jgi:hypothetical protein
MISSLKESVDVSGNVGNAGFDLFSLISSLEYISEVVQCVASKAE